MKKNLIHNKKILFNKKGQIIDTVAIFAKKTYRFYKSVLRKSL